VAVRSKIGEWTISLNKSNCEIWIRHSSKKPPANGSWEISSKIFERDGMKRFPKNLYESIKTNLKYANIYDRFLEKYYNWDDSESL
jgi:hypothetical protein